MPNFFCNIGNILRNVTNPTAPDHSNNNNNMNNSNNNNNNENTNSDNHDAQQQQQQQHQNYNRIPHMPRVHIHPLEELFAQAQQAAATAFYTNNAPSNEFHPPETQPHPPASTRVIRQLPTVSVTPEDLVDENNRECCICFEEHHIRDKVSRLPCAHIYHPQCIVQWLVKNNTCPQCRYELPTDNVVYERGRRERMKARKPRFAKYELQRMHNKELKDLCSRLGLNCIGIMEKKEYVDLIWNSDKVDTIVAPDPVEYGNIEELRKMGVGVLKKNMGDAGVFFDPRDVVEKEDMVQIFVNSGRIVFKDTETSGLQQHDDPHGGPHGGPYEAMDYGHVPRTDDNTTISSNQLKDNNDMDNETTMDAMQDISEAEEEHVCESVVVPSEDVPVQGDCTSIKEAVQDVYESMEHDSVQEEELINTTTTTTATEDSVPKRPRIHLTTTQEDEIDGNHENSEHDMISSSSSPPPSQESHTHHIDLSNANRVANFAERTISELRELADELQVDISNCIEKQDIIHALTSANGSN